MARGMFAIIIMLFLLVFPAVAKPWLVKVEIADNRGVIGNPSLIINDGETATVQVEGKNAFDLEMSLRSVKRRRFEVKSRFILGSVNPTTYSPVFLLRKNERSIVILHDAKYGSVSFSVKVMSATQQ